MPNVASNGSPTAKIFLLGDIPTPQEAYHGKALWGAAGDELNKMLFEAGISRTECFASTILQSAGDIESFASPKKACPHDGWVQFEHLWVEPSIPAQIARVRQEIAAVGPNVIVPLGNLALFVVTGKWGIDKWRGSLLETPSGLCIPTFAASRILAQWELRPAMVSDLRRVRKYAQNPKVAWPQNNFIIRPHYAQAVEWLYDLRLRLMVGPVHIACDIETRSGHIACIGVATSTRDALCIPLMCAENPNGYWLEGEEVELMHLLMECLTHANARVSGQSFLYDAQYFLRHLHYCPNVWLDTLLEYNVCFPGTKKDLAWLSSLMCEFHLYWKDDGKEWNARQNEELLWIYNCVDCIRTFEIAETLRTLPDQLNLRVQSRFQYVRFWSALASMHRGIRWDSGARKSLSGELKEELEARDKWFVDVLGHAFNPNSPKQMQALFYGDLNQRVVMSRAKKGKKSSPSMDDEALEKIKLREPLLTPLIRTIQEYRSLRTFRSTFIEASLSADGRMHTSLNPGGPETFRYSSSESAFWDGMNVQNVPSGDEEADGNSLQLPNVRKLFLPDEGMWIAEIDLDRADLQVVVEEIDDAEMRQAMREGVDMHSLNAKELYGLSCSIADVKKLHNDKRQIMKVWAHGTNYCGQPRTMSVTCGITIHQAEKFQRRWFQIHPGLPVWHKRVKEELARSHSVTNKFGYRRLYFQRIDGLLSEAVAWTPQSTVARVIDGVWAEVLCSVPEVEVLFQVHDSLVMQGPAQTVREWTSAVLDCSRRIVVPYDSPLTIPASIKASPKSWGHCEPL